MRPKNSIFPSGKYLAKSPVLYNLDDLELEIGLDINFSLVNCLRFKYPLAKPAPPICNSPGIPIGTGCKF